MEQIVGQLLGAVPGVVIGDVELMRGKRGHALYTNGIDQRVNLGNQRHNCMGDLSKCNNGFVMAMWLQVHKYDEEGYFNDEYYISNGGHTTHSICVALFMREWKMRCNFRTEAQLWEFFYQETLLLHTWYHLVLAWDSASGGKIYINGAPGGQKRIGITLSNDPAGQSDFMLGDAKRNPPVDPGEMTLDELRIWDATMNETEVWEMYASDVFP